MAIWPTSSPTWWTVNGGGKVGQCSSALLAIGCQYSPGVAFTHPEKLSGLSHR